MSLSDIECVDSIGGEESSNVATEDEFFNELVRAPPIFDNHLIPDDCSSEEKGLEHLVKCLDYRFCVYPVIHIGSLKQAIDAAFSSKNINERCPLLLFINHDNSVYGNLFCKQLLCTDSIIEHLTNNYILWAWDVTFHLNEQKLNTICKAAFASWGDEQLFSTKDVDTYPLLIGIYRDQNGQFVPDYLIKGATIQYNLDHFLSILINFKNKFILSEQQYEKAKEEERQKMLLNLFQARSAANLAKGTNKRAYLRSISMFTYDERFSHSSSNRLDYPRQLSGNLDSNQLWDDVLSDNRLTREKIWEGLEACHIQNDDADDEDDDVTTPTVQRPAPTFP